MLLKLKIPKLCLLNLIILKMNNNNKTIFLILETLSITLVVQTIIQLLSLDQICINKKTDKKPKNNKNTNI